MTPKKWVIGIDEVGRGPIAGPIAVGAVLFPAQLNEWKRWEGLRDSKKLTEKRRAEWYEEINTTHQNIRWEVAMVHADTIDREGIVPAAMGAVAHALSKLSANPTETHVLCDRGLSAPGVWQQEQFTKGDERIPAIALASIMAKVTRDQYMCELAQKHTQYGFEKHKGYGTLAHREAVREHGLIPAIHRTTFIHLDSKD